MVVKVFLYRGRPRTGFRYPGFAGVEVELLTTELVGLDQMGTFLLVVRVTCVEVVYMEGFGGRMCRCWLGVFGSRILGFWPSSLNR
jgi:hypothetical protein